MTTSAGFARVIKVGRRHCGVPCWEGYFAWLDHIWTAAGCAHPIRLYGDLRVIDSATGELLRSYTTRDMPDQVIYKACGNRRHQACPSCAETYRRDAYHVIRSGLVGGKGIPETVAAHPAVFATFTAPSFGPVHTRAEPRGVEQRGRGAVAAHQAGHRTPPRPARPPPWRATGVGPRQQRPPSRPFPGPGLSRQSRRIPGTR